MKNQYERSMFIGDIHLPYHDQNAIDVMFSFMRWFKPNWVFIIGDMVDFYAVSKFDKDPNRILGLQDELNATHTFLAALRKNAKKARIVFIPGNHELRLMKYLWRHPEIANLQALTLDNLLDLPKHKIELYSENNPYDFHEFKVEHGVLVRQNSGYSANGQRTKRGTSGISGHTHRLGASYRTDEKGTWVWLENGCLCDTKPEYIFGVPDWQTGMTIGYYKKENHRFSVEQIPIIHGKAVHAGLEFTA